MKGESKLILGFTLLLLCGANLLLSCSGGEHVAVAKIKFLQARLETNGSLKVDYEYTTSLGTLLLRETDFVNGTKIGESCGSGGNSLENQSPSESSYHTTVREVSSPPPMLVATGQTYYLKLNGHLPIYNFTNNSGQTYRSELSLERFSRK
jgi:hypothetical protein